jgi:hypothetical protein
MIQIPQGGAMALPFLMVDSTDHLTGKTGLTPTVYISKNGGGFGTPVGIIYEFGYGWYVLWSDAADTSSIGALVLHAEGTGADASDTMFQVLAGYPATQDSVDDIQLAVTDIGSVQSEHTVVLDEIHEKTANLPPDPASLSALDLLSTQTSVDNVQTIVDLINTTTVATNATTSKLDTAMEADAAVYRFTANALEQAPSGGGGGADPWDTDLPGAYPAGTAGYLLGTGATQTSVDNVESAVSEVQTTVDGIAVKTNNLPGDPASELSVANVQTVVDLINSTTTATNAISNKLDTAMEADGGVYRYTTNALEQAPVGGGGGGTGDAMQATLLEVKAKTDNLPSDPADASIIADQFTGLDGKINTITGYIDTEVAAIKAKTDQLAFTGGKVDANATTAIVAGDLTAIADAILKRDWTALTGEAAYSLLNAARMLRCSWATTGGTLTVKKEDGSTVAWTRTLETDPTAEPIIGAT